jgi:hypothetical protein
MDPDPGGQKMYFKGLNGRLDGECCCIGTRLEIYLPRSLSSTVWAGQCVSLLCVYVVVDLNFLLFSLVFNSVVDPDPDWIRIQIRIRIQEAKMTHRNRKKLINSIFCSDGCALLRAEGFSCSSDVL